MTLSSLIKEREYVLKRGKIRNVREKLGISREDASKILRVSTRNIYRWENNINIRPHFNLIARISKLKELEKVLLDTFKAEDIDDWLNTSNEALESRTPIQEIASAGTAEEGMQSIVDLLINARYGAFT
ncbi:MAG: helix-turn-helix domain-containing protein [Actinomycetia bacterium]|nr:helix-turn-helix domain-containing protein [Actinomycetes bacterium]